MKCIVKELGTDTVPVEQMEDGDLAEITRWEEPNSRHLGEVVQRSGDTLIVIGRPNKCGWSHLFKHTDITDGRHVRLLRIGTILEIVGHFSCLTKKGDRR